MKYKHVIQWTITALFIIQFSNAWAKPEPNTLWHAAVYQHEVNKDLFKAAELYEQTGKHAPTLELALQAFKKAKQCYITLGKHEKANILTVKIEKIETQQLAHLSN